MQTLVPSVLPIIAVIDPSTAQMIFQLITDLCVVCDQRSKTFKLNLALLKVDFSLGMLNSMIHQA